MMSIDFLPHHYRQMQERRRAGVWRVLVVGVVLILMASSSTMVVWQRQGLARQIGSLKERGKEMGAVLREVALLNHEKAELSGVATLLCLVRFQTPLSRILSAVASAAPEAVTISSVSISKQGIRGSSAGGGGASRGRSRRRRGRRRVGASGSKRFDKNKSDADRLREAAAATRFTVVIQGVAASDTEIAVMLGDLSDSRVLEKANMSYSEPDNIGGQKGRKFQVVCQSVPVGQGGEP